MNQSPQTDSRQKALQQAGVLCYAASRAAQAASSDSAVRADAIAATAASLREIAVASAEAQIRGLQIAAESCQAGLNSILASGAAEDELAARLLGECTAEIGRIISELSKGADGAVGLGFVNEMRALAGLPALSDDDVRQPMAAAEPTGDTAPPTESTAALAAAAQASVQSTGPGADEVAAAAVGESEGQPGAEGPTEAAVVSESASIAASQAPTEAPSEGGIAAPVGSAFGEVMPADPAMDGTADPAAVTEIAQVPTTANNALPEADAQSCNAAVGGSGAEATGVSPEQAAEGELEALSERLSALIAGAKAAISRTAPMGADASQPEAAAVGMADQGESDAMAKPMAGAPEAAAAEVPESRAELAEPTGEVGLASTEDYGTTAGGNTSATGGLSGVLTPAPSDAVEPSAAAEDVPALPTVSDAAGSSAVVPAELSGDPVAEGTAATGGFAAQVQAALDAVDHANTAASGSQTMASTVGTPGAAAEAAVSSSEDGMATNEPAAASSEPVAEALGGTGAEPGTAGDPSAAGPTAAAEAMPGSALEEAAAAAEAMPAGDPAAPQELTAEQMAALMAGDAEAEAPDPSLEWGSVPLALAPEKAEMLQFMVADNKAAIEQLAFIIPQLAEFAGREDAGAALADIASSAENMCDFFDFKSLKTLTSMLREVANSVATINDAVMPELTVRLNALRSLFEQHVRGLECGMELRWPLTVFCDRIRACLRGEAMHPQIAGWHNDDIERVLELDMVNEGINNPPKPEDLAPWTPVMAEASRKATGEVEGAKAAKKNDSSVVRVPAVTLDKMLELISQLVLTKNRLFNLARELRQPALRERRIEDINSAADELTMLTSNLQIAMMQARMQPIAKLFERYERVVSDVAGVAEKQVELKTGGEGVDVDKNIFDGLAEPMSLLLRHIVTKAVQLPHERASAGKSPSAMISVDARNQSSSVLITVDHDGLTLDREAVLLAAVERGIAAEDKLDSMSDEEVWALYTREGVTDPTLKAVAQALEAMKGTFSVRPHKGLTRFEFVLPLSIAIITAILVDIGGEIYAIPLTSVEEIVGLDDVKINRVNNRPVMRLREQVLPIVEGSEAVGISRRQDPDEIGVVIAASDQRATLRVDGIVGKQEIVIKQLEGEIAHAGPFSGATIRNDGGISLIFDVADLLRRAAA